VALRAGCLIAAFFFGGLAPAAAQPEAAQKHAIIAAADARAPTAAALEVLLLGAGSPRPAVQQLAVRALGRLERPELADAIIPLMASRRPSIRAEAANALGQAISRTPDRAGDASKRLLERLKLEKDATVRGAICETLGGLPYTTASDVQRAEAALYDATWRGTPRRAPGSNNRLASPARVQALTGAVKGLEALLRLRARISKPAIHTVERLRVLAIGSLPPKGAARPAGAARAEDARRRAAGLLAAAPVRRLAIAALVAVKDFNVDVFEAALADPDEEVRRLALAGLGGVEPADVRTKARFREFLVNPSPAVRYGALGAYGRRWLADGCAPVVTAVADVTHVALLAIDLLGGNCPASENVGAVLAAMADKIGRSDADDRTWQRPAHALVALARIDTIGAANRLQDFVTHPIWQVRMYAARAAATLGNDAALRRLARDGQDNVREAAIGGLSRVVGHQADEIYLAALERPDYQLIMTAARALGGTPDRDRAVQALHKALTRLTAQDRDTSRDPRAAILERLRELGSSANADALLPYLADFDPRVAKLAADILTAWTGQPHAAETAIMRTSPPPSPQALEEIAGLTARVTMRGLGSFEMRLLSDDAPAAVVRFVRLAREGYYNGLTFHRVVPNFIIQGGSPGANEFAGDGPYMRDEVGLRSNARGTVGVSTRGRDTGDAQIYINLIDNPRLDHDYTVFAEVTRGMEIVQAVLEGDIIERIEILSPKARGR